MYKSLGTDTQPINLELNNLNIITGANGAGKSNFIPVGNESSAVLAAGSLIVLINKEPFDYTKWREQSLDEGLSVRQLSHKAMVYSKNM